MATSSGIGARPVAEVTRRASDCVSASNFHSPQFTTVAGSPRLRRAWARVSRKVLVAV